jgi:maltooligosyltrehalose synthase
VSSNLRTTYRVQFNASFRFADTAAIADYLADLGISHLYCSPYLTLVGDTTDGTMAQRVHNEAFNGGEVRVATLLRQFPVALLTREDKGS